MVFKSTNDIASIHNRMCMFIDELELGCETSIFLLFEDLR